MYELFLLHFKRSYWRMVLRRATWIEAGHSLRRAHKDRRAMSLTQATLPSELSLEVFAVRNQTPYLASAANVS